MSIPMYFAGNWKDSVNTGLLTAQMGYGFHPNGSPRLPEHGCSAGLCVIDDACLPETLPELRELIHAARRGCCFDFERRPSPAHRRLLEAMVPQLQGIILLPEAFAAPGTLPLVRATGLCNDWHSFVRQAAQRHPKGWALELSPCRYRRRAGDLRDQAAHMTPGGCWCRVRSGILEYYDTRESIDAKLETAVRHGCRAMIGLYEEFDGIV